MSKQIKIEIFIEAVHYNQARAEPGNRRDTMDTVMIIKDQVKNIIRENIPADHLCSLVLEYDVKETGGGKK